MYNSFGNSGGWGHSGSAQITVSAIRSGNFPQSVTLPDGATLRDLSRKLGLDNADRLVAMGEDNRAVNPQDRLAHGRSYAFNMKVAGATA